MFRVISRRLTAFRAGFFLFAVVLLTVPVLSPGGQAVLSKSLMPEKLELVVGKSITLTSPKPIKRASVASPDIADILLLSPHQIYVTGKAFGITNMILWEDDTVSVIYDLDVSYDLSRLKQRLHELLPGEKDLRVMGINDSITLAGRISSTANLSLAVALAGAYAPQGKVQNLLEVAGVNQVMLEVRVAEMARSLMKRLGINFAFDYVSGGKSFALGFLGGLTRLPPLGETDFRINNGGTTWTGVIEALKQDGLVKILAEPTLIALSGQTASFLAGGEFPVPVPQGLGTVAIEYKPFGVGLSFSPTVLSEDKISMKVVPEVSELDFSNAVQISGFVIPGLTTRRASTVVELGDGQSFAIAGLLRDSVRDNMSKVPFLGDIPILGTLFRSRSFQKNETELIIIVTPHLVKPLDMAKQSLPVDFYIEPDDADFYVLGLMEGREKQGNPKGELDGDFGYTMGPYSEILQKLEQ